MESEELHTGQPRTDQATPFWRKPNVGRLMALVIPVALYCAAVVASGRPMVDESGRTIVNRGETGVMLFALGVFAVSGISVAAMRRATIREAVVQWCVPPTFLLCMSTLARVLPVKGLVFVLSVWLFIALQAAIFRYAIWQGESARFWPSGWVASSIPWGFADIGFVFPPMFAFMYCFAPLFQLPLRR